MFHRLYITFLINFYLCNFLFSQNSSPSNLPKYDVVPLHFGMALGFNSMDFTIRNSGAFWYLDSIYSIENIPKIGLNINIVSNYNLHPYFAIRFLPGLNLGQRNLEYWVRDDTTFYTHTMKIESTYLDFPFLLQYKAARLGNFRPYILAGGSFKIDLVSQKRILEEEWPKIRLKRLSYYYEIGVGADFFLEYFKFALELKYAVGINNVVIPDNTQYTRAIDRMNSKMLMLSFTFEGSDIRIFQIFKKKK